MCVFCGWWDGSLKTSPGPIPFVTYLLGGHLVSQVGSLRERIQYKKGHKQFAN